MPDLVPISILVEFFKYWFGRYQRKVELRATEEKIKLNKRTKLFAIIREHAVRQRSKKENVHWLRQQLRLQKGQKNLLKFKEITKLMREQRMRNERADEHHVDYLFKQCMRAWVAHYRKGQPLYSRLSHYRRNDKLQ